VPIRLMMSLLYLEHAFDEKIWPQLALDAE
jgi:hypothetical protein